MIVERGQKFEAVDDSRTIVTVSRVDGNAIIGQKRVEGRRGQTAVRIPLSVLNQKYKILPKQVTRAEFDRMVKKVVNTPKPGPILEPGSFAPKKPAPKQLGHVMEKTERAYFAVAAWDGDRKQWKQWARCSTEQVAKVAVERYQNHSRYAPGEKQFKIVRFFVPPGMLVYHAAREVLAKLPPPTPVTAS